MEERLNLIKELHKPLRRKFLRRRVICYHIDDLWQSDLVEMIPYAGQNSGMKYILTTIDVFSKYAWVVPLKSKTSANVTIAFKSILKNNRCPSNLQTDNGNFKCSSIEFIIKYFIYNRN